MLLFTLGIEFCFPSILPTTWGIFQKSLKFFQSSLEESGFRYGSFKALKISSQVSLSIRLKVDFPMRYAKNGDCCDSPEARNRSVKASLSPAETASRRLVPCFVIKGKSSRRRWSYRSGDCSYQSYLTFLWTELHSRIYVTKMALSVYQSHFLKEISVNYFSLYFQYKGLSQNLRGSHFFLVFWLISITLYSNITRSSYSICYLHCFLKETVLHQKMNYIYIF